MENCHSVTRPMEPNVDMSDEALFPVCTDPESPMLKLYQSLTGELLFVACNSVPEIMYVVHQLGMGRYMTKATKSHFEVAKHVLRYLKGKLNGPRLTWCAEDCSLSKHMPVELWAMADSSWADVKPARKSTLCYMLFMKIVIVGLGA